jgi:hypothetical protein
VKKITVKVLLAISLCFCHGAPLWAAETKWENNKYLIEWIFVIFCALVIVFIYSVARTILSHNLKSRKHGTLQRYFNK